MTRKYLPEIALIFAVLLACTVIGLGLVLSGARNPLTPTPRIELRLGDDWQAILRSSTYAFRDVAGHPAGYATNNPVVFVYADPVYPLEFPDARSLYFRLEQERVTEIRVIQLGEAAEWAATEQAVRELVARIERAGWTPTHSRGTLDAVIAGRRAYYADPAHKDFMNDQFLDSWTAGAARLDLSLYRNTPVGDVVIGQPPPLRTPVYTIYFTVRGKD